MKNLSQDFALELLCRLRPLLRWRLFIVASLERFILSYTGLFSLIVGLAFLTPHMTNLAMKLIRPIMTKLFGVLGSMATRGVQAELSRTSVAIAALMVAISAAIGLGIMVGSFRHTVFYWLEQQLWADIYVVPPGNSRHWTRFCYLRALKP